MTQEQITQIEKIVERILQEHLGRPQQSCKPLLAIFGATQFPLEQTLQQLQTCLQDGWKITIILSDLATKTLNLDSIYSVFGKEDILLENDLTNIPSLVESHSQIILPLLSYPMAGKLALKLVDSPCTYLIFHALCSGKQVIATSDDINSKKYRSKNSLTLDEIEPSHVNTLSEFGVKWITVDRIAETIREGDISKQVNIEVPVISATVIANLEADVQELVYPQPAIVTPLAREDAQKRGIKLTPKS